MEMISEAWDESFEEQLSLFKQPETDLDYSIV